MNAIEMNQSVTQEQLSEAIDWASDCMGLTGETKVSAERAEAYVKANYPGGWDAFVAECCTETQAETPQSGYAHCACRDCMEIIVANNPARPELCDDCNAAGCGDPAAQGWPECQRDDAYGDGSEG